MENNKQKIAVVALVAFLVVGVIGVTIAYFTSETVFKNEFKTPAHESEFTEEFSSPENWLPGDEEKKEVSVKNTGEYDIAVRISYTEEWIGADGTTQLPLIQDQDGTEVRAAIINFPNKDDWGKKTGSDGVDYYYYKDILGKDESTSLFMDKVTFNKDIKHDEVCTNVYTYKDGTTSTGTTPKEGKIITSTTKRCESTGQTYAGGTYILTIKIETIQWDQYKNGWGLDEDLKDLEWDTTLINKIKKNAIIDNIASEYVKASTGINFGVVSSDINGKGIYLRAGTENDINPIYYYRGEVEDNNIIFADFCWKIVRTTETGGVKLLYNGIVNKEKTCDNMGEASQIGISAFNPNDSLGYAGYMYGNLYYETGRTVGEASQIPSGYYYGTNVRWDGKKYTLINTKTSTSKWSNVYNDLKYHHYTCLSTSTSCETVYYIDTAVPTTFGNITLTNGKTMENARNEMINESSNDNDSELKKTIDNWYSQKMISFSDELEDTIWCNDREIVSGPFFSINEPNTNRTYFAAYNRLIANSSPSLVCKKLKDSFTINKENGNGKLKYPVGALTADEVVLAGSVFNSTSSSSYIETKMSYWTMTPASHNNNEMFALQNNGISSYNVSSYNIIGVRPSISLKNGIEIKTGDGTANNPYQIEY